MESLLYLPDEKSEYEEGEYPMAVGTSLALEALTSNTEPVDVNQYDEIWINLRTLIRNTTGAMAPETRTVDNIAKRVMLDMHEIASVSENVLKGMSIVIYHNEDAYLSNMLPKAIPKAPKTLKQMKARGDEVHVIKKILETDIPVELVRSKFGNVKAKALMITHLPADLLSRYGFADLTLLESHTGTLKRLPEWSKKITTAANKEYASNLPFNKLTLTIMGDGNKELKAQSRDIVKAYIELATSNRWKATTSTDKIKNDIRNLTDRALSSLLLSII